MFRFLVVTSLVTYVSAQTAAQCTAGQFFDATIFSCASCAIATYQPQPAQTSCINCQPGQTTIGQASQAQSDCKTICQPGQFLEVASSSCVDCGVGSYSISGTIPSGASLTTCTVCPADRPITPTTGSDSESDCREQCPDGQQVTISGTVVTCELCPKGSFRSGAIRLCVNCEAGKTTLSVGATQQSDCVDLCPAGTFRDSNDQCQTCPLSTYSSSPEQTSCTACEAGRITRVTGATDASQCILECPAGTFIDGVSCTLCAAGTYSEHRESSICSVCPSGFTSPAGSTGPDQCFRVCPAGQYLVGSECELCPRGTYQSQSGQDRCNSCGPTKTTRSTGATSVADCVDICRAGTYLSGGSCLSCPLGTYSNQADADACQSCGDGFTTRTVGSDSASDCLPDCSAGTFVDGNVCSPCPRDTYQTQDLAAGCVRCAAGRITLRTGSTSRAACITACYAGTYHNNETDTCMECPPGTYQDEDLQSNCKSCSTGYTTYPDATGHYGADSITRCLSTNECEIGRHNCHTHANCKDQDPGFSCECKQGFEGDGVLSCEHICVTEPGYCVNGNCRSVSDGLGVFCDCDSGYTGDRCQTDVDDSEVDTNLILAAVLGSAGGLLLLALIGLLIYCLCFRRSQKTTVFQQPEPAYIAPQAPPQRVVEKVVKPIVVREPKEIQRYIVHDVPEPVTTYEQVAVPQIQPMTIQQPQVLASQQMIGPPPIYTEQANTANIGVPDVPQVIQTEHGTAHLVSAGEPKIIGQMY